MNGAPILQVRDLHAGYGPTRVLHGIGFDVPRGGIVTILGANGAGKTTTLRAVSAEVHCDGAIMFDGGHIERKATHELARLGIGHVPEGRGTFTELTVEENLRLGAFSRKDKAAIPGDMERVYGYFPVLGERRRQAAGTLSGGEQQMLAVGRALMSRPRLLLLDEPSLGLAPLITQEIFRIIGAVSSEDGVSVLLVEQNAGLALELASYAYVLETGRIVAEGPADELRNSDSIRRSYLGY